MQKHDFYINGKWVKSDSTDELDIINPATEKSLGTIKLGNEKDVENYFDRVQKVRNTPDEIINPFRNYLKDVISGKSSEELFSWAKNQAYLALGNLLTVCANEQIDSCPMEGFIPKKYDDLLNLKEKNLTSVLVLPVGFRADDDFMKNQKKVRKILSDVILEIS